jgi:hypothetical protein
MRTPRARKRCFQVETLEQRNLLSTVFLNDSQGGGLALIITTPTGEINVGKQVTVVSSNALHGLTEAQNHNGVVSFGQIL